MDILKSLELPDVDEVMAKLHGLFERYTNVENDYDTKERIEAKISETNKILTIICDIYNTYQKSQVEWSTPFSINNKTHDQKSYWKYNSKAEFIIKYTDSALVDSHIISQYIKVKTLIDRYHNKIGRAHV